MGAPEAGGQRLLAAGYFLWFSDVAEILRERLGEQARKVPHAQESRTSWCARWRSSTLPSARWPAS